MIDLTIGLLLAAISVLLWVVLRLNDLAAYWRQQADDYRLAYSTEQQKRAKERAEYEDDRKRWSAYR